MVELTKAVKEVQGLHGSKLINPPSGLGLVGWVSGGESPRGIEIASSDVETHAVRRVGTRPKDSLGQRRPLS